MAKGSVTTRVQIQPKVKVKTTRPKVRIRTPIPLVRDDDDVEDAEPDMLAGRSIAHRTGPAPALPLSASPVSESRFGSRRSRFWFKLTTVADHVEVLKEQFKPKVLEHIDASVQARLNRFKVEFPPTLDTNISAIREFLLTEIAPLSLAASGGVTQAKEVVEQMTGSPVETANLDKFEQMVNRATVLRLGIFVLEHFKLPAEHLPVLFGGSMNQETDLSKLVGLLKETMDQPRQDPRGHVSGTTPSTPNQSQIGRSAAKRRLESKVR